MSERKQPDVSYVLRQAGFSELACQFATYIERLEHTNNPVVAITAGLLTEAVSQGHVCLNLMREDALFESLRAYLPAHWQAWQSQLLQSNVVGQGDDYRPLIISDDGSVYLYRHWHD